MTIYASRSYLQKHRFSPCQIQSAPPPNLNLVVVIPCHDEPDLIGTLDSLETCEAPELGVEIIVVINAGVQHGSEVQAQNAHTLAAAEQWQKAQNRRFRYHFLPFPQLPHKHAGVGLARKIGMDEAVDRLEQVDRPEGVILCLDADSRVQPNYLQAVETHFRKFSKTEACSLNYAHPTQGKDFDPSVYQGIIRYELYLRYYIQALRFAGFPHAYHTIGSSMAVRSSAYQKQNGMNRRKAGEDFYFLHKFIPQGQFTELQTTTVIPSPRPSQRVPFGTGKAIGDWLESDSDQYPAYDLQGFLDLQSFLAQIPDAYETEPTDLATSVQKFLEGEGWEKKLPELRKHVASKPAFVKRFYQWFDGLKVLKYAHHCRDHHYPDGEVVEQSLRLLHQMGETPAGEEPMALLTQFRQMQGGS